MSSSLYSVLILLSSVEDTQRYTIYLQSSRGEVSLLAMIFKIKADRTMNSIVVLSTI
jgi:hypothetical protein